MGSAKAGEGQGAGGQWRQGEFLYIMVRAWLIGKVKSAQTRE